MIYINSKKGNTPGRSAYGRPQFGKKFARSPETAARWRAIAEPHQGGSTQASLLSAVVMRSALPLRSRPPDRQCDIFASPYGKHCTVATLGYLPGLSFATMRPMSWIRPGGDAAMAFQQRQLTGGLAPRSNVASPKTRLLLTGASVLALQAVLATSAYAVTCASPGTYTATGGTVAAVPGATAIAVTAPSVNVALAISDTVGAPGALATDPTSRFRGSGATAATPPTRPAARAPTPRAAVAPPMATGRPRT